jgi:hypothetical protein
MSIPRGIERSSSSESNTGAKLAKVEPFWIYALGRASPAIPRAPTGVSLDLLLV